MVLPEVLWNAGWQRPPKAKMTKLGNAIEACVRGRHEDNLGKRSRYLVWTVTVGCDVCPFFYAARTALRIEQQLLARGPEDYGRWAPVRDPLHWIVQHWAWHRKEPGTLRARDGDLLLGEDGGTIIKTVAKRAWEEWLWASENRTLRDGCPCMDIAHARPAIQGHKAWLAKASGAPGASPNRVAWMYATHGPQIPGSEWTCKEPQPRRHH